MTFSTLLLTAAGDGTLQSILQTVQEIANKPEPDFMHGDAYFYAVISFVVSLFSLIISFFGLFAIYRELREDKIMEKCQINLLHDLVRHLYRNKICTVAMRAKYNAMTAAGGQGYPSEEHYKKLQLLPEDIHLERYNRDSDIYGKLHELEMQLRNYNTEIEVAERHMTDPLVDSETEQRDFDTLDFKTGYLTMKIADMLSTIDKGKTDVMSSVRKEISEKAERNLKENPREKCKWGDEYAEELSRLRENERERDLYFTRIYKSDPEAADQFAEMLTQDLLIECGLNQKGEEKIHIIRLKGQR